MDPARRAGGLLERASRPAPEQQWALVESSIQDQHFDSSSDGGAWSAALDRDSICWHLSQANPCLWAAGASVLDPDLVQ